MDINEFAEAVKNSIHRYLPDDYARADLSVRDVLKNNGVKLKGFILQHPGINAAPTVYLDTFFQQYKDGKSLKEILQEISEVIRKIPDSPITDTSRFTVWEFSKSRIRPKLINYEKNKEYLSDKPYKRIADLAITYYVDVSDEKNCSATIAVTDPILNAYNISTDELYKNSVENLSEYTDFLDMESILKSIYDDFHPEDQFPLGTFPMYILTNKSRLYGSSAILNNDVMSMVRERIGSEDFAILPSSVHELIIVPGVAETDIKRLKEIVNEINATQIEDADYLSDGVYHFDFNDYKLIEY